MFGATLNKKTVNVKIVKELMKAYYESGNIFEAFKLYYGCVNKPVILEFCQWANEELNVSSIIKGMFNQEDLILIKDYLNGDFRDKYVLTFFSNMELEEIFIEKNTDKPFKYNILLEDSYGCILEAGYILGLSREESTRINTAKANIELISILEVIPTINQHLDENYFYIDKFVLDKNYRGKHYGLSILKKFEEFITQEQYIQSIVLEPYPLDRQCFISLEEQIKSLYKFYETAGFKDCFTTKQKELSFEYNVDLVIYKKNLV